MDLSCILGTGKINGRELLKLKVDDIIPLDEKMGDLAVINVEGVQKFRGYPGSCNNRKAIKIVDKIKKR